MKTWSITIRPRFENFKKSWFDILENKFKGLNMDYSMCIEDKNHIHIALDCDKNRQDKVREFIIRIIKYKPEDVQEKMSWLKVSEHDDRMYCHGYTQKDEGWWIGKILNHKSLKICKEDNTPLASFAGNDDNIYCTSSIKDIKQCVRYYHETEKQKEDGINQGDYLITSINKLLPFAKKWVEAHTEMFTFTENVFKETETKIVIPSLRSRILITFRNI